MTDQDEILHELALRRARAFATLQAMGQQGVPFSDLDAMVKQEAAYRILWAAAYEADSNYLRAAADLAAKRRGEGV